jgi:hypothetical protein
MIITIHSSCPQDTATVNVLSGGILDFGLKGRNDLGFGTAVDPALHILAYLSHWPIIHPTAHKPISIKPESPHAASFLAFCCDTARYGS